MKTGDTALAIYIEKDSRQQGPLALEEVNAKALAGEFCGDDPAWIEAWSDWQTLRDVPGFVPPPSQFPFDPQAAPDFAEPTPPTLSEDAPKPSTWKRDLSNPLKPINSREAALNAVTWASGLCLVNATFGLVLGFVDDPSWFMGAAIDPVFAFFLIRYKSRIAASILVAVTALGLAYLGFSGILIEAGFAAVSLLLYIRALQATLKLNGVYAAQGTEPPVA